MAKTITFNYDGTEYTLEFTRDSVAQMQKSGFKTSDIDNEYMIVLPELFAGAFLAHHPHIRRTLVDEIFSHFTNKVELVGKLAEMYNDPLEQLMAEPDEDDEKNVTWETGW